MKTTTHIRLKKDLHYRLKVQAAIDNKFIEDWLAEALEKALAEAEAKNTN